MIQQERSFGDFRWIDIIEPSKEELDSVAFGFEIDHNFLEDALEVGHLPKIERTEDYVFLILRSYTASEDVRTNEVGKLSSKIAFFVHQSVLVTIHREPFDFWSQLPPESATPEALVLSIIKQMLLTYELPIRNQSRRMDEFESDIFLQGGSNISVESLYFEKAKARLTRRLLLMMQEVITHFYVGENLLSTQQDLKDTIVDFLLRTDETVEDSNALLNTYMMFQTQKSNDVMKVLTVFSAFFLPLTFIVGVYGMNFRYMPELEWRYGYFLSLAAMAITCLLIYFWFRRKRII